MTKSFLLDMQITSHALKLTNSDGTKIFKNAEDFLNMQEYVFNFYKLDKICTIYDAYNIESAVIGQKLKYFKDNLPSIDQDDIIIKEKKDIYKIKNIDFFNNERSKFVLDLIDLYKSRYMTDYKPRFCGPFSLAVNLRGYNNLINDVYDDTGFVNEFLKIINNEILLPWIDIQRQRVGNKSIICSGADAWVSIPSVNLRILEDIIVPNYKELENSAKNIYFSMLDGARHLTQPLKYLEIQKILNPLLVKGFDPDVSSLGPDLFLEFAKENNMDLLLGIESSFLNNSSLDIIYERIKKYVKAGLKNNNNFILYFNDVPQNIEPDKMIKIINYVKDLRSSLTN